MYTLALLDLSAELIQLMYEAGVFTRKRIIPAAVAAYVVAAMTFDYLMELRGPTRHQMIQKLTQEWRKIVALDPVGKSEENLEFAWYLESLSDEELKTEFKSL